MLDKKVLNIFFVIVLQIASGQSYEIPTPTLEVLSPKGFKISIPNEPGIVLFAFHGSIHRELKGVDPGDFSGEARTAANNKWTYENTNLRLEPGDILYYWISVQYGRTIYRSLEKRITIPATGSPTAPPVRTKPATARPPENVTPSTENRMCVPSKTTVRGRSACAGELIFEDNFDVLNRTQWRKEIRIPLDSADADFVSYQNRPENCYITNGHLFIVPNLLTEVPGYNEQKIRTGYLDLGTECTGIIDVEQECKRQAGLFRILPPVISARIRTKEFFSFRYGRVEVRARLTRGDWLFPQIVLEPYLNEYGIHGYSSGQMRVAFIRGNEILDTKEGNQIDGHRISGGAILTTGDTFRDVWLKSSLRGEHLGRRFAVYSLTWTEETITLAIDGNDYATIRGGFRRLSQTHNITYATQWESGDFMAPFDKEFYISLGVSAGGISDFPDGCRSGADRRAKPWQNANPKAELTFWNDRDNWHKTWEGEDAGLEVDYIKVWAL